MELVGGPQDALDPGSPTRRPACSQAMDLHRGTRTPVSLLTEAMVTLSMGSPQTTVTLLLGPSLWSCVHPLRVLLIFLPANEFFPMMVQGLGPFSPLPQNGYSPHF